MNEKELGELLHLLLLLVLNSWLSETTYWQGSGATIARQRESINKV